MAQQLTWRDLDMQQVETYLGMSDGASRQEFLKQHVTLPEDDELKAITLDLYHYTLQFAQRQAFTADKVSVIFSLMKETHEQAMKNFWPAKRCFDFFKKLLLMHSVQRPPFSVGLFSLADAQSITAFISAGYFRHYLLYKYAFTAKTEMAFSTVQTYTQAVVPDTFLQPLSVGEVRFCSCFSSYVRDCKCAFCSLFLCCLFSLPPLWRKQFLVL